MPYIGYMRTLLIVILLLIPNISNTYSIRPVEAPSREFILLYNQVYKANPSLDHNYVYRLSNSILRVSNKYDVKPSKLAAILAHESRYKLDAVNKLTKDYGIGQINIRTIKAFNFDKKRLLTDLYYSVDAAGLVLADFKRMYGKKEKNYYSRYNSSNPDTRLKYEQLVKRYYE